MPINRRPRSHKFRGSMTHGWGAKKKHRGSGNRGGFGKAGSGKRADQKKPTIINEYGLQNYFGKHGFRIHPVKQKIKAVNLDYLESNLDNLIKDKLAKKEDNHYLINLADLGYDKLLGSGKITKKFKITAKFSSSKAIQKIEGSGGEVILPGKES